MTVRRKSAPTNPVAHRTDKRLRPEKRRQLVEEPRRQAARQSPKAGVENGERRFRATFDLVPVGIAIADQGMPGMSGVEFLGHVRRLYPDIVRILATGTHDPDAIADAVNEAGIQKFLSKDWDGERLRAEVREMYRKHFPREDTKPPLPGAWNL